MLIANHLKNYWLSLPGINGVVIKEIDNNKNTIKANIYINNRMVEVKAILN